MKQLTTLLRIFSVIPICLMCCFPNLGLAQELINNRYDIDLLTGFESKEFDVEASLSLEDSRGVYWFTSGQKIISYDGTRLRSFNTKNELWKDPIVTLEEDNLGNIWIFCGSYDDKVNRTAFIFDYAKGTFIPSKAYLIAPHTLGEYRLGNLFNNVNILMKSQNDKHIVSELRDKKIVDLFEIDLSDKPLNRPFLGWKHDNGNYGICMIPAPNVSIKEYTYFILNYDSNGNRLGEHIIDLPYPDLLQRYFPKVDYTKFIAANKDVKTFVENFSNFISKHNDQRKFFSFTNKHAILSDNSMEILYYFDVHNFETMDTIKNPYPLRLKRTHFDHNEGFWFMDENSFSRANFNKNIFENIFNKNTLPHYLKNRGIAQKGSDIIFVEFINLNQYSNGKTKRYQQLMSNYDGQLAIAFTGLLIKENKLFCSTERHGLVEYSFTTNEFKRYDILGGKFIWQSYIDDNDQVWIGSKGLHKLDYEQEAIIEAGEAFQKLNDAVIYHFYNSNEGTWLCTSDGLYLLNLQEQKILAHYNNQKDDKFYLPIENCVHLYEDKNGIFWIATKGQGLVKWNRTNNKYQSYTVENAGFSNNIIYAVYPDDFGNLWMSSNVGLMRFNIESETVSIFLEEHGLPNNEFNTISHFKDSNGLLYFGTISGMISFDPYDIEMATEETDHFFISTAITTNRKTGEQKNSLNKLLDEKIIDINSINEVIDITLSLPNFEKKNGVVYSYKLSGADQDWTYNNDGKIQLRDLDFGDYELLLRAKSLASKKWTTYNHPIRVAAHTPIHQQWWFRILLALIAGLLIFGIVKIYTHQLVKRQAELEQIVTDRTEEIRFQAEGLRVQAEELKSLDKVKNNFFTNISHELKTPITLILGPLSYILNDFSSHKEAHVKKQLLVLQRNAKNLEKLVEEILDLSKLEANKIELEEVATNLNDFINYVVSAFDSQVINLGIKCEIHNQIDPTINILIDRDKVEKILNNFISNAIKFAQDKGGVITIIVSELNEELTISVFDNGKGIHEKDLPHVFDRFFQTKFGENNMLGGTGIGLALVKELAELMNGQVDALSELGKGSIFTFKFPMLKVDRIDPVLLNSTLKYIDENNEDEAIDVSDFSILIVEDNDDMREFVRELLSSLYENLYTANNGAEALQILEEKNNNFDLIISDVMMPNINGLELFKRVRESKASSSIPFIVLTALSSERDKLTSLLVGVDDYLTKPFSVPELLARVNNLLVNYAHRKQWWASQNLVKVESANKKPNESLFEENYDSDVDKQFFNDLINYIEAHLNKEDLTVNSLAKTFFVSERTLHRKLKAVTGLTPNKLIKEVQLQKARKILENNPNISISEVAHRVGFTQRSTFAIHFKRRFGIVPSKYNRLL